MIAKFQQDLYNQNFSLQDQGKGNEKDNLQERFRFWLHIIEWGGPIPDNVYDFDYNASDRDHYFSGEKIYSGMREFKRILRDKGLRKQLKFL